MGFDSMAAWDKTHFTFGGELRQKSNRCASEERYTCCSSPSQKRLQMSPPSFRQVTASWSPPQSPTAVSPKHSVHSTPTPPMSPFELEATPAPLYCRSSPITPPMTPKERHDLASKLYDASCAGDLEHMALLIALGAPVNGVVVVPDLYESFKPAKPGRLSPLAGAASYNQLEAAHLLLEHGALLNPNPNQSSSSPLHQACRSDSIEMAHMLLELGADVENQNCYKTTPLMYAVKYASTTMTSLILSYAPELEVESFMSSTAVFWGVWPNNVANVTLCLQAGASPNHRMADGSTPLHCAALAGWVDMAECLLKFGAEPMKKNDSYDTPIDVAKANDNSSIARLIKRYAIEQQRK